MDIDDDDRFQRVQWRIQTTAWVLLALVPFAGIAGVFGNGPVSQRVVSTATGTIDYERFARRATETRLVLRVDSPSPQTEPLVVRLGSDYTQAMNPTVILPAPVEMRLGVDWLELRFAPVQNGTTREVRIDFRPVAWGMVEGRFEVQDRAVPALRQFVWP